MTTEVAIANLALSHLGDDANIASLDPPEGSAQAEQAAQFIPIARDALLEMHPWNFATKRATLALSAEDPCSQWRFGYALPSDAIGVWLVNEFGGTDDDDRLDFEIEVSSTGARILYTDVVDARIRYTFTVVDPVRFSPLFTTALSYLLASYLAGPVLKGETGRTVANAMMQTALGWLNQAKTSDAKQRRSRRIVEHTAPWMLNR